MKTIEEKAKEFMAIFCPSEGNGELDQLIALLKEHERDTRHACAEAVYTCDPDVSGECIWIDDAAQAILNTEVE